MKTVLVFRTSVTSHRKVREVKHMLNNLMHRGETWTFDLEDCDHILRVETVSLQAPAIIRKLRLAGFACEELED